MRYRVSGDPASMRVVPTVQIAAITFQPNVAYYGETVNAAIRVLNHYTQPVTGARLIMRLPDNVRFQNGSALPASGFTGPGAQQPPQSITWTLNMPAGSASNPAVQTYTLQLKAELIEATKLVETLVQVPSGVPAGCLEPKGEYLRTAPRLSVATTRFPNTLPALISSARPYTFALEVTNNGTITVTDATITAALPFNAVFPAAFSYIPGSSTMNTVPREPDAYVDGNGGHLVWNNIELGPKSLTRFVFEVMPDGFEYVEYCLTGAASSPQDPVAYAPTFALYNCVKVNPPLGMSKTGDRQYVTDMSTPGGREVTFTLMITNTGTHSYFMGLRDYPASQLEFIRQVSSNNGAPTLVNLSGVQELQWPLQTLLPGERLQAVVVFRVPNGGTQLTFRNELGFRFREANNAIVRVSQIPPVEASISQRGTLYFNISTENPVYGPGDRIKYILSAYNTTPAQPMSSISVDNYLPAGFTFESMAVDSDVTDLPTQSPGPSGRTALHWNLSSVGPGQTKRVTFYARAASIIGGFESWVNMSSGGSYDAVCQSNGTGSNCSTANINSSAVPIALTNTTIEALATLEPSLDDSACVLPGDARTYRLALVNTNVHAYGNTTVRIRLPFGVIVENFNASGSSGVVTLPAFSTEPDGSTLVLWSDIQLPAKPFNQASAQILLFLNLRIGRFAGNVPIVATALSPDGDILRKDDALDPALRLCQLASPMLFKDTNKVEANPNDPVIFQLSAINPTNGVITVSLRDVLPSAFTVLGHAVGPSPAGRRQHADLERHCGACGQRWRAGHRAGALCNARDCQPARRDLRQQRRSDRVVGGV